MAILKYFNKNGELIAVNSYKINNVIVSQTKGQSTADVMSQKAVTDELEEIQNTLGETASQDALDELSNVVSTKANKSDVYTKSETDTKLGDKADKSDTYNKSYIDGLATTVNEKISARLPIDSFNQWSENVALKSEIPTNVSELTNDSGYLTQHQPLTDYAKKADVTTALNDKLDKSTYNTDKPTFATKTELNGKANKTDVYTKTESDNKYQLQGDYMTFKASADHTGYNEIETPDNFIYDCGDY